VLVVSGIGAFAQVLQAELSDADGLGDPVLWSWEFQATNASPWDVIPGATAATFSVTTAQAGGSVRVRAQYTDGKGALSQPVSAGKGIQELETGDAVINLMQLEAPIGAGVITPLTTVLRRLIDLGLTPAEAGYTLTTLLGLPAGVKLHTYNSLQVLQQPTGAADPVALKIEAITLQLAILGSAANDDTGGTMALGMLQAAKQAKVLDLGLEADVAFVLGLAMPPVGVPALVAQIVYSTSSMGSEADGGSWQGMEAIWLDFLDVHQGVVAPSIAVLTIDQNLAPIGYGTAALPSAVRDQPSTLTAAQLQAALTALPSLGEGSVAVQADGSRVFDFRAIQCFSSKSRGIDNDGHYGAGVVSEGGDGGSNVFEDVSSDLVVADLSEEPTRH
jgi:hypothetical protein